MRITHENTVSGGELKYITREHWFLVEKSKKTILN